MRGKTIIICAITTSLISSVVFAQTNEDIGKFLRVMVEYTEQIADFKTQKLALEIEFSGDPETLNFEVSKLAEDAFLAQQRIFENNNTNLEEWSALNEILITTPQVLQQYLDNNPDLQLRLNDASEIISE